MATNRPHTRSVTRKTRQRARYAALSRGLSGRAQMPESFLSPDHQNYQAAIAENISGARA